MAAPEVVVAVAITLDLVHRVTDEELRALSEHNPGYQFERTARGDLIVSPTGSESGRRSGEVLYQPGREHSAAWRSGGVVGLDPQLAEPREGPVVGSGSFRAPEQSGC